MNHTGRTPIDPAWRLAAPPVDGRAVEIAVAFGRLT
jgi:hypothetical protein